MFVKQIDMKTALELAIKGSEVKILIPSPTGDWVDMLPQTLENLLAGCIFFRQEPAMVNPEFEAAVQEMSVQSPPPHQHQRSDAESSTSPQKSTTGRVAAGAKRRKVDAGKILALHNAGWSNAKIADEMSISDVTVWKYLKEARNEEN